MAKKIRMSTNQIHDDASSTKMINSGVVPWSDLNHDVLLLIMMQIGVVDFLAFGGVCKSWRSLAHSNRNKFMASKEPMSISISTNDNENECYLQDFKGRKFKTTLPHSTRRICAGLTCGYLIMFCQKTRDCYLVNPITRHELHFHAVPFYDDGFGESFRAVTIFSPSISRWVLVVSDVYSSEIWFSIAGKREWTRVTTLSRVWSLHAFKGKIYIMDYANRLCELKLHPTPKFTLLEMKNFPESFNNPVFVSSGENLYLMDPSSNHTCKIHEISFSKMEYVSREDVGAELWVQIHSHKAICTLLDRNRKDWSFYAKMWYSFHDCVNVNF